MSKLNYDEALQQLQEMFPNLEKDLIVGVMIEKNGVVDEVIQYLLIIQNKKNLPDVNSSDNSENSEDINNNIQLDELLAFELQNQMNQEAMNEFNNQQQEQQEQQEQQIQQKKKKNSFSQKIEQATQKIKKMFKSNQNYEKQKDDDDVVIKFK